MVRTRSGRDTSVSTTATATATADTASVSTTYDFKLYSTATEAIANAIKDTDDTYCYANVSVGIRNLDDEGQFPKIATYYIHFQPTHSVIDDEELSEWVQEHWEHYCRASNFDSSIYFLADDIALYKEPIFHNPLDAILYLANWYRTKVSIITYKQFLYFVSTSTDFQHLDLPLEFSQFDISHKPTPFNRSNFHYTLTRIIH